MSGEVPDMLGANAEILRSILSQPLPDTLDMIIWRGVTNSAQASPFERFAARLLVEAGAAGIRDIAAENDFDVIRLSTTKRFWLRCNGNDLSNEQFNVVQAVESALNRIDYADDEARRAVHGGMPEACIDENFYIAKSQQYLRNVSGAIVAIDSLQEGENNFRRMRGTSLFTLYIGLLWLMPYMQFTETAFYMYVTGELDQQRTDRQHTGIQEISDRTGDDYNSEA